MIPFTSVIAPLQTVGLGVKIESVADLEHYIAYRMNAISDKFQGAPATQSVIQQMVCAFNSLFDYLYYSDLIMEKVEAVVTIGYTGGPNRCEVSLKGHTKFPYSPWLTK